MPSSMLLSAGFPVRLLWGHSHSVCNSNKVTGSLGGNFMQTNFGLSLGP